jgi:hypothetical protein
MAFFIGPVDDSARHTNFHSISVACNDVWLRGPLLRRRAETTPALAHGVPDSMPTGDAHNFLGYTPDPKKVLDYGCVKTVVRHSLEISLRSSLPGGDEITVPFESCGATLEEVVLRSDITGRGG